MIFLLNLSILLYTFSAHDNVPNPPCAAQSIYNNNDTLTFKEISPDRYCVVLDVENADEKGLKTEYYWQITNNIQKKGKKIDHCFDTYGRYNVVLTAISPTPIANNFVTIKTNQTIYLTEITNIEAQIADKNFYFDGSDSFIDNDYKITDYYWDFGDGTYQCGAIVYHTYNKGGKYEVKLIAQGVDTQGNIKKIAGKKTYIIK